MFPGGDSPAASSSASPWPGPGPVAVRPGQETGIRVTGEAQLHPGAAPETAPGASPETTPEPAA
ncbi:hypothetical protein [Streptomyces gobiensis]|uniref:hypothetical protein n=1 Tax=Streptomyces gobiensis TaxID=2875706 RepID=UPI001E30B55F|nr:hypothetical protein [Streptomyces gobiensis]UGY90478.1 hypothetical protein test1122_01220 [Streptomyces gobiensis]